MGQLAEIIWATGIILVAALGGVKNQDKHARPTHLGCLPRRADCHHLGRPMGRVLPGGILCLSARMSFGKSTRVRSVGPLWEADMELP